MTLVKESKCTIFHGREIEISKLMSHVHGEYNRDEPVMLITGEPGDGKTALLAQFSKLLRTKQGVFVMYIVDCYHY